MNIKQLRKKRGITQEELAAQLEVHENTIRMWEKGSRSPRISDIKRLCEIFQCTESELLNGSNDDKIKITLVYDWDKMKEGNIDMEDNDFELILGSNGRVGLKGAGLITSHEAIEDFLGRIRKELEIALDAQVRRGVIPEA